MKVLTKYILRLSIGPFLMGIGAFVIFASVELLYQLSDIIVRHRVGISKLFELIYYNLPYFVSMGIPVGILFSIFWVLSQLYSSKEITALLVHGIPSRKLVYPFLILSIVFGGVSFYLNDQIVPRFNQKATEIISKYVYKKPELSIRENILTKIDEQQYFFAKKYDQNQGILYDVVLFQNFPNEERIITAKKVEKEDNSWFLINGKMYVTDISGFMKLDLNFSKIKLDLKEDLESLMRFGKSPRDMTGTELNQKIQTFKKLGIDPAAWIVELHSRYANSIGPFIIAILGVPLSLLFGLKSKSWSVIFTFVIVVTYQGSGAWLSAMGKENLINPVLSAWYPNIIFAILGIVLFLMLDTPLAYRIRELLAKFLVFSLVFFFSSSLFSSEVTLDASDVKYYDNYVFATGNVNISWNDIVLISDEATIFLEDSKAKFLEAFGNVKYIKQDEKKEYYSNFVKYYFDENKSYALKIRGIENYKKDNETIKLFFCAENATESSNEILMKESYVTTCELDKPHYKIEALNVYIYENKFLVAENSILFLLDFPFLPYPVYFINLSNDELSPFSFSFSWSEENEFETSQQYNVYINDYLISTTIETGSFGMYPLLEIIDKNKVKKFSLNYEKSNIYLNLPVLKYNINWDSNRAYLKLNYSPFYFEEKASDNYALWSKKLGFSIDSGKGKIDLNYYWESEKSNFNNSFSVKGLKKNLRFGSLNINNASFKTILEKNGFIYEEGKWSLNEEGSYSISFNNKNFSTRINGKLKNESYINRLNHTFNYPLNFSSNLIDINGKYTFGLSLYNAVTDKYYFSHSFHDIYELNVETKFNVFKLKTKYEFRDNFRDEATTTEYNRLKFITIVDSKFVDFSLTQGWDFLNNKRLDDRIYSKFSIFILYSELFIESSASYDNEKNELSPYDVTISFVNSPNLLNYKLKFKYYHDQDLTIKEIKHMFTFQKLRGNIEQSIEKRYVKNAYVSGTFSIYDYKNVIELFYKNDLERSFVDYRYKYTIKKDKNSLSLSYKKSTNIFSLDLNIASIDPRLKLNMQYNTNDRNLNKLKFSFAKKLHHFMVEFSSEFKFNHDNIFNFDDVEKLSVLFYVIEFDEKFIGWDFIENAPEIGLF